MSPSSSSGNFSHQATTEPQSKADLAMIHQEVQNLSVSEKLAILAILFKAEDSDNELPIIMSKINGLTATDRQDVVRILLAGTPSAFNAGIENQLACVSSGTISQDKSSDVSVSPINAFASCNEDNFVQLGKEAQNEDPFVAASVRHTTRSADAGDGGSSSSEKSPAQASSNWRSRASSDDSPSKIQISPKTVLTPQATPVSSQSAQAHFPPSACVFVANLLQHSDDEVLFKAVTKAFSQFGHVYVKVRRGEKDQMPFAFCQYTSDDNALRAEMMGKDMLILGRPCRTEMSLANVYYYLCRKDATRFSVDEASKLMTQYGPVESITKYENSYVSSKDDGSPFMGQNGMLVQFMYFDTGRDAIIALQGNSQYTLQQMPKKWLAQLHPSPEPLTKTKSRPNGAHDSWFEQYQHTRCSIFVGSLPAEATEATLRGIFSSCGAIFHIEMKRSASKFTGDGLVYYAFIEFTDGGAAARALIKNDTEVLGSRIRVHEKMDRSSWRSTPRPSFSNSNTYNSSHNFNTPAPMSAGFMTSPPYPTYTTAFNYGSTNALPYPTMPQSGFQSGSQVYNSYYSPPMSGGPAYSIGHPGFHYSYGSPTYGGDGINYYDPSLMERGCFPATPVQHFIEPVIVHQDVSLSGDVIPTSAAVSAEVHDDVGGVSLADAINATLGL